MGGSGFTRQMNDSLKANRSLLKRKSAGKYKNFDTSYITDYPVSKRKRGVFNLPKATPAYMSALKKQLLKDRDTLKRKNRAILTVTALRIAALTVILFSIHF